MKKRIASIALSLAMCLTLLPTAAYAEDVSEGGAFDSQPSTIGGAATVAGSNEAVDTTKNMVVPTNEDVEDSSNEGESGNNTVDAWDGTADTSWYVGHEDATEYHIATVEELAGLAQLVNDKTSSVSFENKTIYLDNDLDLSDEQWVAIGNGDNNRQHFAGTFDGQYHKIINLYHHYTGDDLTQNGLFGVISSGGTVKNLMVVDADIVSNDGSLVAGILADWVNDGTVENCYTSGKIENNNGNKLLGGLIGQCTAGTQVKGCGSDANVISTKTDNPSFWGGDTVGGLIGQWENSEKSSLIADCWFGGSVSCEYEDAGVAGILGANFDFRKEPGVKIKNCMVATKNITCAEPGNITWITAAVEVGAENCIWPDSAPADVSLDEEYNGNYLAAVKLKIEGNNAYMDPDFNQSVCGNEVSDFTSKEVLEGLQAHQGTDIEWVAGIKHPTFKWDKRNISADYTEVDKAIAEAEALRGGRYTNYDAVEDAVNAVDRNKSVLEQDKVNKMAQDIRDAIAALKKKKSHSSGGSSVADPTYTITTSDKAENGTVSTSPKNASKGDDVTITATPDKGYEVDDIVAKDAKGNKLTIKDNGDGTYTFTMPASKVTVTATFAEKQADEPVAPEKLFADVSADAYYYEAVKWASENGVTGGIGENLFGANLPCTRAQIVTFLWRAAGSPEPKGMSGFVDVSADAYYAKAVAWAVEQGIVSGTSATTFNPDAVCTRAQSVAFLYRAFGEKVNKAAGFSDVSADAYYADAVAWAVENGVASGIGGGLFAPDQDCARGQIVAFLYRAYQNK